MTETATLAALSVEDRVATLTLRRTDKRNALSLELLTALHERIDELRHRNDVNALIITGEGKAFSAGMDLRAVLGDPDAPLQLLSSIAELAIALRSLPAVVIAKANGAAIGGGCGLMVAADIALTHPEAKIGFPEIDLGVCPAVVTPLLINKIGPGPARRILLTGGTMTGLEALQRNLVDHCVPAQQLDDATNGIAQRIAAAGTNAIARTKQHLAELDGHRFAELLRRGAERSAEVIAGPEARQRLAALYN